MSYTNQDVNDAPANQVVNIAGRSRKSNDPSGEAESLKGKLRGFGDRHEPAKVPDSMRKKQDAPEKQARRSAQPAPALNQRKKTRIQAEKGVDILNVAITEDLIYRPKTRENRLLYEQLLNLVNQILEDEPQDVLRGVTDEVLASLKFEDKKDVDKKGDIEAMLNKNLSPELFNVLLGISKQINDYTPDEQAQLGNKDEEVEVAIDFDEEKDKDEDDEEAGVIAESDDEDAGEEQEDGHNVALAQKEGFEDMNIEEDEYALNPQDIDPYWIQTQLNKYFTDAHEVQKKAEEIMAVLNAPTDIECENKLVDLLEYDRYDLIKLFSKNRHKIYYCTRLKQSQNEKEAESIRQEMRKIQVGEEILDSLEHGKHKKDKDRDFARIKKEVAKLSKAAKDTNQDMEIRFEDSTLTDAEFASMSKKTLDLENLTFTQGGHLMSNEKCSLPKGSFKLTKKGYEEVFVPAVKYKGDEKPRVKIADLPNWSQPAFEGYKELTRIQSDVFHCAFETDENMLVCAPTGSGKTIIALLTVLHQMSLHRKRDGSIDINKFKVVYIAPMKALVSEIVGNLTKKLESKNATLPSKLTI